jgi:hypothetical protein
MGEPLIILASQVSENDEGGDALKQEAARVNWCLPDVLEMHGDVGVRFRSDARE